MNNAESTPATSGLAWFKSTYSDAAGNECVEVAWRKSSYSDTEGNDCVEFAACTNTVHIRDSKNTDGPQLALAPTAWADFTATL
ncbi:DUF397 domain-containing protein [Streptomyces acidiscabies]|uniref:DUF397 domain-containing protein n=1 Tax=Streptomyces acidiscabies TaxID=42234 RepID=A0AAP6B6E0_9ACTN|nr:DUF397 domain-containing protein [Streptomyces acidiscabies]MBP5940003.1 DUF397 domain-containing protein [Streptomyces sp. LBUM 1476]MBZ3911194.1 DUF397 domain-containing protein [Streptomyces acidiscabies]MDX2959024.1 DUF397 domain-containing protein [Streptomyces acidiscabies]MDX3023872.1 DUF397 domain-containing protein [Streptomyces acidiscabies]MDX3788307.1 DUF397 domain-containing protein [Streptomyces acidiscabies]